MPLSWEDRLTFTYILHQPLFIRPTVTAYCCPHRGAGMTIVGTTDSPSDITMEPVAPETDVRFIVDEANRYLNRRVSGGSTNE
jgi:hypothetical protein